MEKPPDWRSENYAQAYETYDRTDFAQEFLRRNPDYQHNFAGTEERIAAQPGRADQEREGLAGRWGLSFPLRPKPASIMQSGYLGPRPECRHGHSRRP